jgi:deferrochelatase/peroxidase EfeB
MAVVPGRFLAWVDAAAAKRGTGDRVRPVRDIERRAFLAGSVGALGVIGGAAVAGCSGPAPPPATPGPAADRVVDFHGPHQAGILTPRQRYAAFVAFDLTAPDRAALGGLLRALTDRARTLTAGGPLPENALATAPPPDSGLLGPRLRADGLSVTVGLGSSAFDGRYGLGAARPRRLRPMDSFPNDRLDRAGCDGDLLLQLCAEQPDTVAHAVRELTRATRDGMRARWSVEANSPPPRPAGAPRNHLGFKDGTANPDVTDPADMDRVVWVGPGGGEPGWAGGGSYQVVRVIRMRVEPWDALGLDAQQRIIGRRKDSGSPLSGGAESDQPDYATDPDGTVTPFSSHVRAANPGTPATERTRILRRGYNYDRGLDGRGDLDVGQVFVCFQQDLDRQFVAVQGNLANEPLARFVTPVGGGYFFALPGVRDRSDWYGRALLA